MDLPNGRIWKFNSVAKRYVLCCVSHNTQAIGDVVAFKNVHIHFLALFFRHLC